MSLLPSLALAAGLLATVESGAPAADPGPGPSAVASTAPGLAVDQAVELSAPRPRTLLEAGMSGEIARLYAAGLAAVRSGDSRGGLAEIRKARALCYRVVVNGPGPRNLLRRHFIRIAYVEAQLAELILIEEQIPRLSERPEDQGTFVQLRAMLLHNLFLAARSFTGRTDQRFAALVQSGYERARIRPGRFKNQVQLGYAVILAERGDLPGARAEFAQLSPKDVQADAMDLAVAFYHVSVGENARGMARLVQASLRPGWAHSSPGREGSTVRAQAYRMNDFDRLRDHPRFIELITEPEEANF